MFDGVQHPAPNRVIVWTTVCYKVLCIEIVSPPILKGARLIWGEGPHVAAGSSAHKAGQRRGMRVQSINGHEVGDERGAALLREVSTGVRAMGNIVRLELESPPDVQLYAGAGHHGPHGRASGKCATSSCTQGFPHLILPAPRASPRPPDPCPRRPPHPRDRPGAAGCGLGDGGVVAAEAADCTRSAPTVTDGAAGATPNVQGTLRR